MLAWRFQQLHFEVNTKTSISNKKWAILFQNLGIQKRLFEKFFKHLNFKKKTDDFKN